jgi:hypothetical protein
MKKYKNHYQHLPYALRLLRRPGIKHKHFWNVSLGPKMSRPRLSQDRILRLKKPNLNKVQFAMLNASTWQHMKKRTVKIIKKASNFLLLDSTSHTVSKKNL